MSFNDANFMLKNEPARRLYERVAAEPIFDFHCHLNPQEIFEDKVYEDIVELWLSGDHYKWRLMRANGISEAAITGSASSLEKFKAWAKTVGSAYGNPLFHWSHLELKRVFGIDVVLSEENAETMFHDLNRIIHERKFSPRKLIQEANVRFIGTTDHPLDDLDWHKKLAADSSFETVVAPTFRPDEVFVSHAGFASFLSRLEDKEDCHISSFSALLEALEKRVAYFAEQGCRASDISFEEVVFERASQAELDKILQAACAKESLSVKQVRQWQTAIFLALCALYEKYDLVAQVHFGVERNNHSLLASRLGADIGVDSMSDQTDLAKHLNAFLDELVQRKALPKMIWFNLNPTYNILLANVLANFQANEEGIKSKLQLGAGWWFNDTKLGMMAQMDAYAEQGMLASFVGMLTDSRSFLSYQRHDYFRRILCSYVGQWIEAEEVPADYERLSQFVANICYKNAEEYFTK